MRLLRQISDALKEDIQSDLAVILAGVQSDIAATLGSTGVTSDLETIKSDAIAYQAGNKSRQSDTLALVSGEKVKTSDILAILIGIQSDIEVIYSDIIARL